MVNYSAATKFAIVCVYILVILLICICSLKLRANTSIFVKPKRSHAVGNAGAFRLNALAHKAATVLFENMRYK